MSLPPFGRVPSVCIGDRALDSTCAVVVHPGTQHSLEVAAGLARFGLLKCHLTGCYNNRGWLTRPLRSRAGRGHPLVPAKLVRTRSREEIVATLLSKCIRNADIARSAWLWRNRRFGVWAGRIAAQEAKVLHCFDTAAAEVFRIAKLAGVKSVLHACTPTPRFFERILRQEAESHPEMADTFPNRWFSPEQLARRDAEYALADCIVAPSSFVRRTLIEEGIPQEKISFVPLGTDVAKWTVADSRGYSSAQMFRAVFAGTLTQWKGLSYLLDAWKLLRLPKAELLLIGRQIGKGRWFNAYQDLNIRRLGHLHQDELKAQLARSHVFVFPSLADGFGMVIPQAMSAGLPVITTPGSCGPDLIEDGVHGKIVPCRDEGALAAAIERLYRHRGLCRQMGVAAREHVRGFTWDRFHRAIADLTRGMLEPVTSTKGTHVCDA